jgi:hypothetical protein
MRTLRDLVIFLHRACFSPVVDTWCKAIDNGNFATWTGLTSKLVRKHLPKSMATAKGHLRMSRKNVRSTKPPPSSPSPPPPEPLVPFMTSDFSQQVPPARTNEVLFKMVELTGLLCTDQTGRFPSTSSRGTKSVMVAYEWDSNAIIAVPLKNHFTSSLVASQTQLFHYFRDRGLRPKVIILYNECPLALKTFFRKEDVRFQLSPPNDRRTNPAEKAIDTWKCHFIAGLASVDPAFPIHLWCRLIRQCNLTLNLLRTSRINPDSPRKPNSMGLSTSTAPH